MAEPRDERLTRPDGRTVAWTDYGPRDGRPLVRMPGTPGSRWTIRADRSPWDERRLRVITTERPGFGASTPLPGRGFTDPSDDVAALLDHLELDRVLLLGASGGGAHVLSFAARHPDRVAAATVLVGLAPLEPAEADTMIDLNRRSWRLCTAGDRAGEESLLGQVREAMMRDPLAAYRGVMSSAPPDDKAVMSDPGWQAAFVRGMTEALAPGVGGWVDESMALNRSWADIDLAAITASITWFHAAHDRNCPLSAARRLTAGLTTARFVEWPADVGHHYGYRHEGEILDELISRG